MKSTRQLQPFYRATMTWGKDSCQTFQRSFKFFFVSSHRKIFWRSVRDFGMKVDENKCMDGSVWQKLWHWIAKWLGLVTEGREMHLRGFPWYISSPYLFTHIVCVSHWGVFQQWSASKRKNESTRILSLCFYSVYSSYEETFRK